ncbi:protein adenylyltransferase SelO family protein, partial [Marivivens donghaensis]|uniref:protein adenylyltransferase SelO family protein n=1 Tax=Marivivens donghaensis TaxID=1699413 RepID=UPI003F6998B5
DYGPCTFMDAYHPATELSSIDRMGRYAYANQPHIAIWNLAQFATSLVPMAPDQDATVERLNAMMGDFAGLYRSAWIRHFAPKLGLTASDQAEPLAQRFLKMMEDTGADFTLTFANLDEPLGHKDYSDWRSDWMAAKPDLALAAQTNPQVIPRLHRIEEVIREATEGNRAPFDAMLSAVTAPFAADPDFARAPEPHERVTATFCGT